jgi:ankyrin repeat protein
MGQTVSTRLFTACEAGLTQLRPPNSRPITPTQYALHPHPTPTYSNPGEVQTVSEIIESGVNVDGQWTDGSTGLHVSSFRARDD